MDGKIKMCNRGFHACESPFDVFDHYTMIDSRFCEVEQDGNISKKDRGTKICSSKIKIKAELKLADMINLGVEWLNDKELNLCINCIGSVFIMRHIGKRLRGFSQKAMCDMEFIC